jgi:hypothetical protein
VNIRKLGENKFKGTKENNEMLQGQGTILVKIFVNCLHRDEAEPPRQKIRKGNKSISQSERERNKNITRVLILRLLTLRLLPAAI